MVRRAFTMMELLVVMTVIAILTAVLLPAMLNAKKKAQQTSELLSMHSLGIAFYLYLADTDDVFPTAYYYSNDTGSAPILGEGGYVHWSHLIKPYVSSVSTFVSKGDPTDGFAPTNFTGNNAGCGHPASQVTQFELQDKQVCRISYTANSMVLPRKRRTVDPMNVISPTAIDDVASVIFLAPQTRYLNCVNGVSSASGNASKTHRPTNAILINDGSGPDAAPRFQGEDPAEVGLSTYYAITMSRANSDLTACKSGSLAGSAGLSHITYADPSRWDTGANYVLVDMHVSFKSFAATIDPSHFYWGRYAYTAGGGAVVQADGVSQVN